MRKFYKPWNVSLVVMLMIVSSQLFAQSLRISGSVKDESGQPVPGVNILEKGTTNGTVADVEGNYTINVSQPSATLVFSFIGYKTLEVPVDSRSQIDALMVTDVTSLEEVVVTGYSTEKKGDIIGSVASVKTSDLLATPSANLQAQLQGRAAGVTVSGSGEPGAGAKVRIRGFASFGNNDPLYVVDGTPTENPSYINPQDIESLQVLKDATAASIYGSRAANGVVIITTKKGKAGSTKVTVDSYYGSQFIPESTFPKMANPQQYGDYLRRSWQNSGVTTIPTDKVYGSVDNPTLPEYVAVNASGTVFRGIESDPAMNPSLYNVNPNAPRGGANFYQIARLPQGQGTNWFKEVINLPLLVEPIRETILSG
jgi:TonB-dependent SusC/RagA subfamily outer membrane receptor